MKPLPSPQESISHQAESRMPVLPTRGQHSATNRRADSCATRRAYPWLLVLSTTMAGMFCYLYLTKPVIVPAPARIAPAMAARPTAIAAAADGEEAAAPAPELLPSRDRLPGEEPAASDPRQAQVAPPATSAFEETNLRIQHILTAETPGGQIDRLVLDVPVLYQSRHLRWTADEVAAARKLLASLMDYQEKCRHLRVEGLMLLDAWNHLVEHSLPATELRADSPSLPANQQDAADAPRPSGLITTESIEIQPATK